MISKGKIKVACTLCFRIGALGQFSINVINQLTAEYSSAGLFKTFEKPTDSEVSDGDSEGRGFKYPMPKNLTLQFETFLQLYYGISNSSVK